jgi:hypothetical protein
MIMEAELWKQVYKLVTKIAKGKTIKRAIYSDSDIVLTYMWAVINDRPVYWACKKSSWPIYYRRRPLPNPSTMTRRLRTLQIQRLLRKTEDHLVNLFPRSVCRWIDAKPLPIGGCSKDKQSAFGRAAAGIAKGYKFYAIADKNQGFVQWTVRPMNQGETTIARELITKLEDNGYLIGDGAYDKNHLYDLAGAKYLQLVTPQRIRNAKGLGHFRHSQYRLRAMDLIKRPFGQSLISGRTLIERMFGNLTCFPSGLKPLPHWVRTLFRVEMWVRAKVILYHLWRLNHVAKIA